MTFRYQLEKVGACQESLDWVKDKTIKQAWETCEKSNWMLWILSKTGLDLVYPICDMAEEVLHLVTEDSKLACIWAISAARRRASKDELDAAHDAANADAKNQAGIAADAARAAAAAAFYSSADRTYVDSDYAAVSAAAAYCAAAYAAASSSVSYYGDAAYRKEQKNQCDILLKYLTIDQVSEAFNRLVVH